MTSRRILVFTDRAPTAVSACRSLGALHILLGREGRMASLFVALPLRVREEPALRDRRRDDRGQNDDGDE
jgi:hypothetical protein